MTPMPEAFFQIRDVADALDVSTRSVRRWIDARLLKVHRFGRSVRISDSSLKAFLAKRGRGT
jgi:excisionase family DNA binding protein